MLYTVTAPYFVSKYKANNNYRSGISYCTFLLKINSEICFLEAGIVLLKWLYDTSKKMI